MPIENTTPNRGYQLPNGQNFLADDVLRIIAAFSAIDIDMAARIVEIASKADLIHGHVISDITGLASALTAKQDVAGRGAANGYAALGADGKVPAGQLPDAILGALKYQTNWNASANSPAIPPASSGNRGWYYVVTTAGSTSVDGITDWEIGDWIVSDGTKWSKIDNTDQVVSVAGLRGAITAAALKVALAIAIADVSGLQTALDGKATAAQGSKADNALSKDGGALTGATGGDPGSGKLNAKGYQVNGKALWGAPDVLMQDQKASGTAGGTFTSGAWQRRDLNTIVYDPSGLMTLASNEFTPAVNGYVKWSCPAINPNNHKSRLYNVTDGVEVAVGSNAWANDGPGVLNSTFGGGPVVAGKTYRIEHRGSRTQSNNGFGQACSFGNVEVYTIVEFWRAG